MITDAIISNRKAKSSIYTSAVRIHQSRSDGKLYPVLEKQNARNYGLANIPILFSVPNFGFRNTPSSFLDVVRLT